MSKVKLDPDSLTMTEIIQLQTQLSQSLQRRFERQLALAFTDVAGSTQYFARFGDEAGRRLVQRCIDLLSATLAKGEGRIVDTAGDGAFTCFPSVELCTAAMVELQQSIMRENLLHSREQQLSVRCGIHYGPVLTDGVLVSGDSVNLCSRVASSANGGEIRLTRAAFQELSPSHRLLCRDLKMIEMKGIGRAVEVTALEWRDTAQFPTAMRLLETGTEYPLPDLDVISVGRLREHNGMPANDIVLELPDPHMVRLISRWHFELRRRPDGLLLRAVSDQGTEVDGKAIPKGHEVPLRPGMQVRIAGRLTLLFQAPISARSEAPPETQKMYVTEMVPNLK